MTDAERKAICAEIGCSGMSGNCPGNPACGILQKIAPPAALERKETT